MWTVLEGNSLEVLKGFDDNQFDSVVTDPPYGLSNTSTDKVVRALTEWVTGNRAYVPEGKGFMGKKWDEFVPPPALWDEVFRVLKPGGHVLSFGGTRTYGLMEIAMRLAGFEIRDSIHWIYGSGFPKEGDVGKKIDKAAGAKREVIGTQPGAYISRKSKGFMDKSVNGHNPNVPVTAPATEDAKKWSGWSTSLKPAHEPILVARKPMVGTVVNNVLTYGTGAMNIDACRIATTDKGQATGKQSDKGTSYAGSADGSLDVSVSSTHEAGRWPPNIILTHSPWCQDIEETLSDGGVVGHWDCVDDCPIAEMDRQSGISKSPKPYTYKGKQETERTAYSKGVGFVEDPSGEFGDSGGASRFFPIPEWFETERREVFRYNAKASKKERPEVPGLPGHPTVKPLALMRWLVKLVTQPGGKVLDPHAGTGTTAEACLLEGMDCVIIESDPDSIRRIDCRMSKHDPINEMELDYEHQS